MRLRWVDSLKGIGIFLVVFAHHSLPQALDTYIFSFHMPLFFFISGFLFNFGKYTGSAVGFVRGRIRSLIVPYFSFALLTCLFYFLLDTVFQPHITNIEFFEAELLYMIHSILYALGPTVSYNPPLWFLTCLFVTELLFYGITRKFYWKPGQLMLLLIAAAILGYLYSIYIPFRLPWNADVALSAVVFYGAGNLFRRFTESEKRSEIISGLGSNSILGARSTSRFEETFFRVEKFLPLLFIPVSLLYLGYLLEFPTDKINMNVLKYGGFFSFHFLAFSGIFAFVYLFKKLGGSKILEYYGRNSLIVLGLHFPIKDVLTKLAVVAFGIELECFYCKTAFALGLTVLNLICLIPLIFLINNYFPFLLGRKGSPAYFKDLRA
ncbi:MAG TPA: acyltransferase family protein, partial [Methanosarcina sp.]|nr:acyltransferase family protein [Methanosarcina sp.]